MGRRTRSLRNTSGSSKGRTTHEFDELCHSAESITVTVGQFQVGSILNAGFRERWADQQETGQIFLSNVDRGIEPSDCDNIHVTIHHSTNGNDDWKFGFTVTLVFSDNSVFVHDHLHKETLTKNTQFGVFDVPKAGLPQ
jgi:hypothetical protein